MGYTKIVYRILPGLKWFRGYTGQDAVSDLIAGVTVGLTVLPQGLAYATLAGLEPQVSTCASFSTISVVNWLTIFSSFSMACIRRLWAVLFMLSWAAAGKSQLVLPLY